MGLPTHELRVIRHGDGAIWSEDAVVLHDGNHWLDAIDRLPNPVVIPIKVDAQEANLAFETTPSDYLVDVLASNKHSLRPKGVPPKQGVNTQAGEAGGGRIHEQALPVVVHEQEPCVGLAVVLNTYFDETVWQGLHEIYQVLDNPVVAEL